MENRVLEVLLGSNVIAAGLGMAGLANVGDIGFFDADTNLSVNAAGAANVREYYVAARVKTGIDGILKSKKRIAGRTKDLLDVRFGCPVDFQAQVIDVDFTNAKLDCEEAYSLKLEVYNGTTFKDAGYNFVGQTYTASTDCCEDCNSGCGTGNCVEFVRDLATMINADTTGLLTAEFVDRATNPLIPALIPDLDAWATANPTLCPSLRLTFGSEELVEYCKVNLMYEFLRGTYGIVSFTETCTGVDIVEVTPIVYEENHGYDINQLFFEAGGYNDNPGIFRVSDITYSEHGNSNAKLADNTTGYCTYSITYNHESPSGWHTYKSPLDLVIAISEASSLDNTIAPILNALHDGFTLSNPLSCCGS